MFSKKSSSRQRDLIAVAAMIILTAVIGFVTWTQFGAPSSSHSASASSEGTLVQDLGQPLATQDIQVDNSRAMEELPPGSLR